MAELFKVNAPVRKPLFEGVQGENEARSIQFDITPWVEELGDGAVTATAKRSQDSQPYPVTVTKDGNTVTWKPTSTDTAFAGVGSFQLEYTVGGVIAKTCIWSTMVAPSLDPAGDPPDPYDNWLAEMREIEASAIQAAQDADASADAAEASAQSIAGDHNELINIRVGADGTTYASAGGAVRGQVSDLKSDLDDFTEASFGINLFDGDFDESGYIDASGQDASSSNFKRTSKYYPIVGESNGYLYGYLSTTVDTFNIYFYGADKSYLGVKTFNNTTTGYVAIPTGATQFRVFTRVAFSGNVTLALSSVSSYVPYVPPKTTLKDNTVDTDNIKDDAVTYDKLNDSLKDVIQTWIGLNLFDGDFDESGYIDQNGNQPSANFKRTSKYYPIVGENTGFLYGYLSETVDTFNIDLYDSNKNYIDVVTINNATTKTMNLPSTAKYFRIFTRVAFSGNATIALSPVTSYIPYEEHYGIKEKGIIYDMLADDVRERISWLNGKNIVFMGDSLVGNFYDSTGICSKLAKETGANVINCAFGGTQMALRNTDNTNLIYWNKFSGCSLADAIADNDFSEQDTALANMTGALAYFSDRLTTLKNVDWDNVDIVMWEWGVNDFQNGLVVIKDENDLTSLVSYYGAYCHTIETLLNAYPHLRIIPITPMWRCWLDEDDDSYLYGADEHEIANQLLPNFAKCAVEVAEKYHLPIIDNYFELDANKWTYTQYFSGHDGVHPNANGRARIANRISHKAITML